MYGFPYQLVPVCTLQVIEGAADVIGDTPEGGRFHTQFKGGTVEGPRLNGIIRPGGLASSVFRPDDVLDIDIRMTLEMKGGALIYYRYGGVMDFGAGNVKKLFAGQLKGKHYSHTTPRMITAHPDYQWVNRRQFIGIGEVDIDLNIVRYDVYELNSDNR